MAVAREQRRDDARPSSLAVERLAHFAQDVGQAGGREMLVADLESAVAPLFADALEERPGEIRLALEEPS